MFGQATLDIPRSGGIEHSRTEGLSDELARTMGRAAAWTLSGKDGLITVCLESGDVEVIRYDGLLHELVIGHSEQTLDKEVRRLSNK